MASANETEIFQHYQVLKRPDGGLWELGRGAMGITYKAFDTNLRCDVALKVINALHLDSETARARFLREARAAAGLRHRNVASVYHLGNDDQSFFYAMEFVDGDTVECVVKEKGPMAPTDALQIVVQIARALGAAAKQNLVHRDIKPANIMVTMEDDEDERFVVKVIDFGLARPAIGGEGSAHITMGGFVGTPQFASPEQLEEKDLDARSDIYSLGVTLWYMLAGKPPFTGPLGSVFIQQLTKEPPWAMLEGTPQPVLTLLANMLQKDPDKRPQTPVELRRQIEACLRQLPASDRQLLPSAAFGIEDGTTDSVTGTEAPDLAPTRSAVLSVGSVLAGRYELVEAVGEGNNGRVFRATDRQAGGASVAVKILHSDVLASSAERRRIETELGKLRASPHPNLLEFTGLLEEADSSYLVGEWVNGFTLVDLLRSRGQLPLLDTLHLAAQAAVTADHARACDLRRLELSLHQVMTGFEESPDGTVDTRAALTNSLDQWPPFTLKFDAIGITREAGDSVTWGGDMTMMPAAPVLGRDTQTSIRGFVEGSDLFALGLMIYELLSGAPPAQSQRGARYVALPALNEAANMVLRRALSANPGFATNVEFFKALVDASGLPQTFIDLSSASMAKETFAVELLPVSGIGAEDAGATLVLEDGASLPVETITARGPSAEERARIEREAAERGAVERAEQERQRVAAEQEQQERRRIAAERAEQERQRIAAERAEAERQAAAERAEAQRVAAERAEAERLEAQRIAAERTEAERLAAEKLEAERAEARRIEAARREAERIEAERVAAEQAEARRIEAERIAAEKAEAKRLEAERVAAQKAEAERLKAERAEAQRIEAERIAVEREEARRQQAERVAAERAEAERLKVERAEAKRVEAERLVAERAEAERIKAERAEAKRLEAEQAKAEKAEAKRRQLERAQAEKAEAERQRAALRDVAGVTSDSDAEAIATSGADAGKKKGLMFAGLAGGVVLLLGVAGFALYSGGHKAAAPKPAITKNAQTNPVDTVKPDQPTPEPTMAAIIPTPEPTPEVAKTDAAPTPAPTPEVMPPVTPTPMVAEETPAVTPAPTPEVSARKQDDSGDEPKNTREEGLAAKKKAAEEKRRREEEEKVAARERERDREAKRAAATPEPERPKRVAVAKTKPPVEKPAVADKPKPTPAPVNRPAGPFILR